METQHRHLYIKHTQKSTRNICRKSIKEPEPKPDTCESESKECEIICRKSIKEPEPKSDTYESESKEYEVSFT